MMTQAFYTGISGLQSFQSGIDTVSDNLANASTIGFRGYNTEFASLFERSVSTASSTSDSIGVGVYAQASSMDRSTGSLMLTDRSTDIAILGDGWFGVTSQDDTLYTRAGNFGFDRDSDLVTTDGFYVLGTMGNNVSADGVLTTVLDEIPLGDVGTQERLNFPNTLTYPPEPTTIATFMGNIGTEAEVTSIGSGVVDSEGNNNRLRVGFTQIIPQVGEGTQWEAVATVQNLDSDITYDTQTGRVEFDGRGALISNTLTSINNNGTAVAIDMGTGFDGLVAISNVPVSASSISDGMIGGDLEGYAVDQGAEVIATFTNGMQSSVGKIAVYHFINEQGLGRTTGTLFSESNNSGEPFFHKNADGENVIGTAVSNYHLESSNVRMEVGLTDLIIYQRAFDANSKSITTADEMMQKALSMDA